MTALVIRGGRLVDPARRLDHAADVLVQHGRVVAVGAGLATPPGATVIDAAGACVSPGWVDSHTHVYGDIGLDDPDTAGVLAGVTTVVDAGSSGSATVDELLDRATRCRTDVRAILYLDRRGIADTATIPTRVADIPAVPIGDLRRAVERHGDRIVAVKTGVYADLGRAWGALAVAAAELVGRPLFVHVGNFQTHAGADLAIIADLLDQLRPGDVVTHCYTAQPGGLIDERGDVLPQALAAAARGVAFDVGHSGAGYDEDVARRALAQGLRPTTVSSDIAVINVRQRVQSLAHVLGRVGRLGFSIAELVSMVTDRPRTLYGLPVVHLAAGYPADLTIFAATDGELAVRWTLKDGNPIAADVEAAKASRNIRFQLLDPPAATRADDVAGSALLAELARLLPALPLDGEVLQSVVKHVATGLGLGPAAAGAVLRRAFADRTSGNPPGWLLAEHSARLGVDDVADRLAAASHAASRVAVGAGPA